MSAARVTPVDQAARRAPRDRDGASFASVVHINEKGGSFGGTEEYIALVTGALGARGVRSSLICGVVTGSLPPGLDVVRLVPGLADRKVTDRTAVEVANIVAELDLTLGLSGLTSVAEATTEILRRV